METFAGSVLSRGLVTGVRHQVAIAGLVTSRPWRIGSRKQKSILGSVYAAKQRINGGVKGRIYESAGIDAIAPDTIPTTPTSPTTTPTTDPGDTETITIETPIQIKLLKSYTPVSEAEIRQLIAEGKLKKLSSICFYVLTLQDGEFDPAEVSKSWNVDLLKGIKYLANRKAIALSYSKLKVNP